MNEAEHRQLVANHAVWMGLDIHVPRSHVRFVSTVREKPPVVTRAFIIRRMGFGGWELNRG